MLRRLDWVTVLCMTGLAAGCGEVRLTAPSPDGGSGPVPVDAAPGQPDGSPVEPRIDAGVPVDAAEPPPIDPSLLAWYPLDSIDDGFSEDVSGNQRHAQCVPDRSACPALVPGQVGMAMAFDGSGHLRVDGSDGFFDTTDEFTIAVWVQLGALDDGAVMSKMLDGANSNRNSWQFEFSDTGEPAFTTANEADHDVDFADAQIELDTWVHLAGTWDGQSKRFYLDGVLEYELPYQIDFDGSDFIIGADENSGSTALSFTGRIDEVRIYDRALDEAEIIDLVRSR